MSLKHVKAGDKLWLQYTGGRSRSGGITGVEIEVTKVGRTWAYFQHQGREARFSLATGDVDAGEYVSWGTAYYSKGDFEREKQKHLAWARLRRGLNYMHGAPTHLTTQDINGVCGLLGIPE